MIYINKDDLTSIIQDRLMNESVALAEPSTIEDNTIVNDIEKKVIDLVISYIGLSYNHTIIFDAEQPIRNGVLVQIIASIVTYRSIRRNAARKVPEDLMKLYTDSVKELEKIQSGAITLVNCPKLTTDDGTSTSPVWGNNTKDEFFI